MIELPGEVRRLAVFDTNAYRRLAHRASPEEARRRALTLVQQERSAGIQALAYPPVLFELLAHLSDPEDPSYKVAKAAVVAAVEHSSMPLNGARHPAIWVSPDLQLCITFWQRQPDELLGGDDLVRGMAKAVADDPSEARLTRMRPDLERVRQLADSAEREFANSMKQHLMDAMVRSAAERGRVVEKKALRDAFLDYLEGPLAKRAVAQAHILRAQSYAGTADPADEINQKADVLEEWFPAAIALYLQVVKKIARSNWDLTQGKGANLLWDLQVAFLIGADHTLQGRRATVVTGDKEIRDAATEVGLSEIVVPYGDYRSGFGVGNCDNKRLVPARPAAAPGNPPWPYGSCRDFRAAGRQPGDVS